MCNRWYNAETLKRRSYYLFDSSWIDKTYGLGTDLNLKLAYVTFNTALMLVYVDFHMSVWEVGLYRPIWVRLMQVCVLFSVLSSNISFVKALQLCRPIYNFLQFAI